MSTLALAAALAAVLLAADAPSSTPKASGTRPARLTPGKPHAPPPERVTTQDKDTMDEDRLLAEQKCTRCHDLARVISNPLSESAWRQHQKRIGSGGACITPEQARRIQAYIKAEAAKGDPSTRPGSGGR